MHISIEDGRHPSHPHIWHSQGGLGQPKGKENENFGQFPLCKGGVELGWGASSNLSTTTTLSLKPSQTRSHSVLQIGRPSWWSMHDIFIFKIVGLCMIFFHSWNCDIAHDFSFENMLVNNAFFIFLFSFAKLLVNAWFFFCLHNCWRMYDFFVVC